MFPNPLRRSIPILALLLPVGLAADGRADQAPTSQAATDDSVLAALSVELARSMDIQLEDLEKPYLIRYQVEERLACWLAAEYGALTVRQRDVRRTLSSRVRVGSYDLDNTNFTGTAGRGTRASLPIDDDLLAIRQSAWLATDRSYKRAVETMVRKRTYLEQKNIEDRPADYTRAEPVVHLQPRAELVIDEDLWVERLKRLSARFKRYTDIQYSEARLAAGAFNLYTVDSEGTRLRVGNPAVLLTISARLQADDGMRLADSRTYGGFSIEDLPAIAEIEADLDELCQSLVEAAAADSLEEYTGPVLFDSRAAGQVLASLLAPGLAGRPDPIGSGRRGSDTSLDKKLGKRILPTSFQVYDDPTVKWFEDQPLFGWYEYDDEAVPAQRVDLVIEGILETQVMARAPTRKIQGTTGHGRVRRFGGDARAAVANLFVSSDDGQSDQELTEALRQACREEGLEFGLRVTALQGVTRGGLADPLYVYKVYVDDPPKPDERVRGMEFKPVEVRSLRRILAAGKEPHLLNYTAGSGGSVIAPAILFEELELTKIEQEFDKLPILQSPAKRRAAEAEDNGSDRRGIEN